MKATKNGGKKLADWIKSFCDPRNMTADDVHEVYYYFDAGTRAELLNVARECGLTLPAIIRRTTFDYCNRYR